MKNSSEKPQPKLPVGERGRFIGLVATGKERYQVHLLETAGESIVKRTVISEGRSDTVGGKLLRGDSLPVALAAVRAAMSKHLMQASDLWRDLVGK